MAVDIREVARRSGVSVATVSRALNGRPDVSDATRARVTETARVLGYQANQTARALVRRRSDMVGLIWDTGYVTTKGRVPFLQDLLVGLKMALADTGYHLMLLSPQTADGGVEAFVRAAAQHSLDGVVLMGVNEHLPAVNALIRSGPPCVGLDLPVRGPRASYVSSDNRSGAAAVVAHLHALGHRRIATVAGPIELITGVERLEGYRAAMAAHDLEVHPGFIQHGDFFIDSGYAAMQRLLTLPEPPTAVFVAADHMAIGAMRAIREAGLEVPADISIVGYDDVEAASLVHPTLTTLGQDYLAFGAAAVSLLTRLIDERPLAVDSGEPWPSPVLLAGRLVVRESTTRVRTPPSP